jgi:beta propeller repeat protein
MSRVIVIAVVVLSVLLAFGAGQALAYPPYAVEQPLATGASTQSSPQQGDHITAWEDDAAGDWDVVVGWQLSQSVVPAGSSDQRHPAVGDSFVVYEDDRSGDWDLYACAIGGSPGATPPTPSASQTPVATGAGDQQDPAVSGDLVVYQDDRHGNWDIALHDLGTGRTRFLTTNKSDQVDPAIHGSTVVFADHRNGSWDIYSYDLKRGTLKRLTTNKADQTAPQIGQGKVVYQDHRNGNWDVYECDLASGKERRLTRDRYDQTAPQIDPRPVAGRTGNVVYVDDRRDAGDIYLREGRTGFSKPVCAEAGAQTSPSVISENVVWCDERTGQADVYACSLSFPFISLPPKAITPPWNGTARMTGFLLTSDSNGQIVHVAGYGATRTPRVNGEGDTEGRFTVAFRHVRRKVTLRIWYAGDPAHLPIWGGRVVIKPQASLSRPSLARSPKPSTNGIPNLDVKGRCTVSGTLRPRHPAGTRAVTVIVYRLVPYHDWKAYRTLRVRVRDSGTASAYSIHTDLPRQYLVRWRVQAVHADGGHARTESPFSRIIGPPF